MKKKNAASLHAVSRLPHLRGAWNDISLQKKGKHRDVTGSDGTSINQFADRADENLQLLSLRLRKPTPYEFSPLKPHLEQKKNGSYRVICVPTVRDRIVQRALLNFLQTHSGGRYAFANDVSYGFIKGKTVQDAIDRAKDLRKHYPWAYKTDIASFFDVIDRAILRKQIERRVRCTGLHPLLIQATHCEIKPRDRAQRKRIRAEGIRTGYGLRQGMPLSPYLSNLMLWEFDLQIIKRGIRMVRYADDLVFFASNEDECKGIHEMCVEELAKIELKVHPLGSSKSMIVKPEDPVEFLGVEIVKRGLGYSLEVSQAQIDRKKTELMGLKNIKELVRQRITLSKFIRTIDSKIVGWIDAYGHCDNVNQFEDKLREWRKELLDAVLIAGLGITSPNLEKMQFLELKPLPPRKAPMTSPGGGSA